MSENELRPCPFCGCTDNFITVTSNPFSNDIYSTTHCKCYATGPFIAENYLTGEKVPTRESMEDKATERWNTRPIEDALNKRIAELEEAQRWIPVSERLPDVGKVVHVISINYIEYFTKTELVYETAVLVEIDGVKMFGFVNEFSVWSSGDVTHWMYAMTLPQPPEVQE